MITEENISIALQVATVIGMIFAVYLYFRKPQEKSETNDAVFDEKLCNLSKNTDEKIGNLKDLVINLRDNHIHTLQSKLEDHIKESQDIAIKSAERQGEISAKLDMLIKK